VTDEQWQRDWREGHRLRQQEDAAADMAFDREHHDDADYDYTIRNYPEGWVPQ
jgi:hypothetical protein